MSKLTPFDSTAYYTAAGIEVPTCTCPNKCDLHEIEDVVIDGRRYFLARPKGGKAEQ